MTQSTPVTNPNTDFLLLNTEFQNDTFLFGFELLGAQPGAINIKVK